MHQATRRQFLKTAGKAAAAAFAAPALIPTSARGAPGHTPPSSRISIGLIGMGRMCASHLATLLGRHDVHITAICDVESTRLEKCRRRVAEAYAARYEQAQHQGCDTHTDFRELLGRSDIDAVLIATPTHWHAVMSAAACQAGKDVYCEKPLALTIGEGRAVAEAARRYATVFQTGSQQRSDQKFRFACELVRNGRIGTIREVYVNVGGPPGDCYLPGLPTPPTLDWDMWLGPTLYRPYHHDLCPLDEYRSWARWRYYRDFGGGGMTDWGAHHFDIAQWGLGMDADGPVEIVPPTRDDVPRLAFRYANGTTMYHGGASAGSGVDFVGTAGRISVNRGSLRVEPESLLREVWGPGDIRLYESRNHLDNWFACIQSRRKTICPAEIGHRSVSVCHLGNLAYQLQRPLRWNPSEECFLGDETANRLRSRPLRSPWQL